MHAPAAKFFYYFLLKPYIELYRVTLEIKKHDLTKIYCEIWCSFKSCSRSRKTVVQLSYAAAFPSPANESNESNPFCCTIFTSKHSKLWSAPAGLFGPTTGCSSTVQRCYELWCSSQSWFLHLGLLEMNGVEHMQTNAFVHGDKAGLLAADLHSYTVCYCFPFVASCHSLCQSLIRAAGFRRLISHFSNFLTLHNERRELKGTDWEEGAIRRAWVRGNILRLCVCLSGDCLRFSAPGGHYFWNREIKIFFLMTVISH